MALRYHRISFWVCTFSLCCLGASRVSITVAQERNAGPAVKIESAVWELCDTKRTWRVILFPDGKTSEKDRWSLDGTRLKIGPLDGRLSQDRSSMAAEVTGPGGGGTVTGKLVLLNTLIGTKPSGKAAEDEPKPAAPPKKKAGNSLEDKMLGTFQLSGSTRDGKKIDLPVTFSEDHTVLDGSEVLASWSVTGKQLKLQLADEGIGEAILGGNANDFTGKSKSPGGDNWTWTISRVRVVAVWDTNGAGPSDRVTFYSNGRVNNPTGEDGSGHWWIDGKSLQLWGFKCELQPDGRSFTGNAPHLRPISGQLFSGELGPRR